MATVADLITTQTQAVDDTFAMADGYLQDLLGITNVTFSDGFNIDSLLPSSYEYAQVANTNFPVSFATQPTVDVASVAPPEVEASTFTTIVDVDVPDLSAVAPVIDFPVAPSSTLPAAPAATPEFLMPDIPTAPLTTLPAVPTFAALALPETPSINLPAFLGSLPVDDMVTPTAEFQFFEAVYSSTLLDPLKAELLDNLENGGYGIDVDDEAALLNRFRDRAVETALTRAEEAGRNMAARGFPLPPGELSIHLDRAYQTLQNEVSGASRDIFIDSAKRFVENRQFTIREVKDVEQILIGFHNSVQERALNAAKATVEFAIAIYNTTRERYIARLEAYKAEAAAFADRVRGELAKAEIYRTQIEGKRLEVAMHQQLVEVYLAQLRGVQVAVDIYKIQMDAAAVRAGIERTKLEAYRAGVEAYTAQVQAKVAEFGMYRAQIEGQTARVGIYEAEVRAFGGQVAAAKVKSDVQLGRLQAESEQARIKLANFQGQLAGYDANIRRLVDTGKLKVDIFRSTIENARALTDGFKANAELQLKAIDMTQTQNTQISQVAINNAQAKLLASVEALKFKTGAVQYGSEKFFALLTALESTINTLAVQTATETA